MTLTEMITLLRRDLHDEEASNQRWTDQELERYIQHAVRDYSEALPDPATAEINTLNGGREVSLATLVNRVHVEAIEYPVNRYPPVYVRFSLWGDSLTLQSEKTPDGSLCRVYYGRLHTLGTTSSIPAVHEDLICGGAAGYAAEEWAQYSINRINNGGLDAPASMAEWGADKLKVFRVELKKLGRRNRIRLNRLFRP